MGVSTLFRCSEERLTSSHVSCNLTPGSWNTCSNKSGLTQGTQTEQTQGLVEILKSLRFSFL